MFTVNSTIECSSSTFLLRFEHKKHIAVFLILKISAGEVAFPTEVFTQNSYKRYRAPGYWKRKHQSDFCKNLRRNNVAITKS